MFFTTDATTVVAPTASEAVSEYMFDGNFVFVVVVHQEWQRARGIRVFPPWVTERCSFASEGPITTLSYPFVEGEMLAPVLWHIFPAWLRENSVVSSSVYGEVVLFGYVLPVLDELCAQGGRQRLHTAVLDTSRLTDNDQSVCPGKIGHFVEIDFISSEDLNG